MTDKPKKPTEAELRETLSRDQYAVTQLCGTEPPFSGRFWDHHETGTYACVVCKTPLFRSDAKFESGTGWPSFYDAVPDTVATRRDVTHGMVRVEILCGACEAHLGHVFDDGPRPTGLRYCVNSASLDFVPDPAR
jgi:peptide-methionine (R)-S-oxide reductase